MKLLKVVRFLSIAVALSALDPLFAQAVIGGNQAVTGILDNSGATGTIPNRSHTGSPVGRDNCTKVGETFFQTDAPAGSNIWAATATGTPCTWTLQGAAGMASQLGDFAVSRTSTTVLSIGGNCSTSTPCIGRFGTQIYSFTSPATATISAGSGTAYIYVDPTGVLAVGSSLTITCNTACVYVPGITNFPVNSVPIYTWTVASGVWDSAGGVDRRGWLIASPVLAGTGIASVTVAGQTTISADGAVVPAYFSASATINFPSISAGTCASDITFSLPGASAGDAVAAGWPAGLEAGLYGTMRVSASNVVSVRLCASTSGAVDPASAVFTATVVRGF